VQAAGSVFLGDFTPEALGDYCSGTNHVLPTGGAARAWSGVGGQLPEFRSACRIGQPRGIAAIGPCAVTLARAEGWRRMPMRSRCACARRAA
jgi:histidinol dehydrogenase